MLACKEPQAHNVVPGHAATDKRVIKKKKRETPPSDWKCHHNTNEFFLHLSASCKMSGKIFFIVDMSDKFTSNQIKVWAGE